MKELRAYQQSEAYKMCTEKIQEKKIKKGGGVGAQPGGTHLEQSSPSRQAQNPAGGESQKDPGRPGEGPGAEGGPGDPRG